MEILLGVVLVFVIVAFLFVIERERKAHRAEVQTLLNKIQHPQIYEPASKSESTGPHHLPYEDDEAWKKWMETS